MTAVVSALSAVALFGSALVAVAVLVVIARSG